MSDRTEIQAADPIDTLHEITSGMPCRDSLTVLTRPVAGARPSRGRSDQPPVDGTPMSHPDGWGIAVDGRKEERDYRDWWIACTVRPPQTAAERTALARAMAQRWDRITSAATTPAPSDYRDRGKVQSERKTHADLRSQLVAAGLLD